MAQPPLPPGPGHRSVNLDQLFGNAKSSFLASLTPEERDGFKPCASAEEVLSNMRAILHVNSTRRSLSVMRRIQGFSDCLAPYFKIIEIICQSNPEWSCIAWGAFRLILEVSRYPSPAAGLVLIPQKARVEFLYLFRKTWQANRETYRQLTAICRVL